MSLVLETLHRFFTGPAPAGPGDLVVVAFSGGPDSTALLQGLAELAPARSLRLLAAHLDHGLDPGSAGRAAAARREAERLGVEYVAERREVAARARRGESPEAAARGVRYDYLEEVRDQRDGRWIATAHHRDDQAETVLLRLLQGTGLEGLAGIQPVRGRVVRPLLELGRAQLERELQAGCGDSIEPLVDPTNWDLRVPRNRVRLALLPLLEAGDPDAGKALARLAGAARRARAALDRRLEALLEPIGDPDESRATIRWEAFESLPEPLRPHVLAFLERRAGASYPASRGSREELARQLAAPGSSRVGCDLPRGWRWESDGPILTVSLQEDYHERRGGSGPPGRRTSEVRPLPAAAPTSDATRRAEAEARANAPFTQKRAPFRRPRGPVPPRRRAPSSLEAPPAFSYTLPLPGQVEIPELGITVRVRREPVAPWMFRGAPRRAALALPVELDGSGPLEAPSAEVRNRRPGDRLRPLGAPGRRKLKDVLIDRRVPRRERDRLPLLCVGGRIAWVPGVTVDEAFRLPEGAERDGGEAWTAEVIA